MITGIGCDIVEIERIGGIYNKYGSKFENKIFTEAEIASAPYNFNKKVRFYAKRFAAKEAYAKALGTGIGAEVKFLDIEVNNDVKGKPYIITNSNKATDIVSHLSLSDGKSHAIAYVIIEKRVI